MEKKYNEHFSYRPSMYVEKKQHLFLLTKENIGLNIGKIDNNNIYFSKDFENQVIPLSHMKESDLSTFSSIVVYWTLKEIWVDDINILKKYNLLN